MLSTTRKVIMAMTALVLLGSTALSTAEERQDRSGPDQPEDLQATTPSWIAPDAFLPEEGQGGAIGWPRVSTQARPGAYWWWPGSAVTPDDLTWNLETYRKAGWGNMGVIGIYGVRGYEDQFLDIFSPKWFAMFNHAVAQGRRLGMNIDLTPSAGWRMGGPHVTPAHAEQNFAIENGRIVGRLNGAKVKRAGPGGAGLAINPYSESAVAFQLDWIDKRIAEGQGAAPRAYYYDSFENPGNWCPEMLDSFRKLRGYSLEDHSEALAGRADKDHVRQVVCDYRETLSDILIDRVKQIVQWAQRQGSGLRMQAHGAPANLIDMYAAATIPETEVFGATQFDIPGYRRDPELVRPDRQNDLVNRFASSAAHVAGRNLVISESFTWLRNHYHTALSHIKAESDNLLINGVNGIYYHGSCYAPKATTWPGWLFYASTEANARNSIFRDIPLLNAYITRCQSVLQEGRPHQDVLLYWPVYDLWMSKGNRETRFSVHHPEWIEKTPCGEAGQWMIDHGYTFDFVSDQQLLRTDYLDNSLQTAGGNSHRTVLLPAARAMKIETVQKLFDLAEAGATILIWKTLPDNVPGWLTHENRKQRLEALTKSLPFGPDGEAVVGRGKLIIGDNLQELLRRGDIARERMVDQGLKFIRRSNPANVSYFVANHSAKPVNCWVPVASPCQSASVMDPMTARTGIASIRVNGSQTEIYLQLEPGETRILRVFAQTTLAGPDWPIWQATQNPIPVRGTWTVEFVDGGPVLPEPVTTRTLRCWTQLGAKDADRYAGAGRYSIEVDLPNTDADAWFLDLGDVRESARVWVNEEPAGLVVAHPYRVDVSGFIRPGLNKIVVEVTNLSANRIRDLDRRGVNWKRFYDINLVDQMYKPFDASGWELKPSGLLGPVLLIPYRHVKQI